MSGSEQYPPPGWTPPGAPVPQAYPPPGYAPYGGWQQPGPPPRAAHKPGAIPLRPLSLGDLYDGAFKVLRLSPKATVGSAALVSAFAMFLPVLATVVVAGMFDLSSDVAGEPMSESDVLLEIGALAALGVGTLLQTLGLFLVTGMVSHVVATAAVGRRISLGEAWALTRGRRWRLVALSLLGVVAMMLVLGAYVALWVLVSLSESVALVVAWGVITVPAVIAFMVWTWVRVYLLAVPAMMLERTGVFAALGRAYRLTSRQFWRTFGIALLTVIITGLAAQLLSLPVSLVGVFVPFLVEGNTGVYLSLMLQALATVLAAAFVTPYTASVTALQYVDQRIRKEAYDVELLSQAGISAT